MKHKYPFEKHYYTTEDDYILCAFRINGPKHTKAWENQNTQKPVVVYQHGLLDSGVGFVCDGPKSIAFYLADLGFDVWLNNSRGNRYSRQHTYLDPDTDKQFWDYGLDEFAKYD